MYEFLKNDDKLFRNDLSDVVNDAIIDFHYMPFTFYADGYKIAADRLIGSCILNLPFGRDDIDVLVYPIVFNYRHYVELRLKEIILALRPIGDGKKNREFKTHNLKKLWEEIIDLYRSHRKDYDKEDFENAERIIFQLHVVDEASFNFRYPTNKKGDKTSLEMSRLNIRNFGEVMHRLADFLDSLSGVIDDNKNV